MSNKVKQRKEGKRDSLKENSQKNELRDRIIMAARDSFVKHGIKSITMDDIAADLGISKRTLYEIFHDKEELLIEVVNCHAKTADKYVESIIERSANVLEVIMKAYLKSMELYLTTNKKFFEDMEKYPKVNQMIKERREQDDESTVEFLNRGVDEGLFRGDVNLHIIFLLLREQMGMLMHSDICEKYPFMEVYESIMFTIMRGISTEKGKEIVDTYIQQSRELRENKDN